LITENPEKIEELVKQHKQVLESIKIDLDNQK
jgi:hypothetical protein